MRVEGDEEVESAAEAPDGQDAIPGAAADEAAAGNYPLDEREPTELGADVDEWREGDADFYDVFLAEADVEPGDGGVRAAEALRQSERESMRRWRRPEDATDVSVFFAGLQAKRDVPVAVVSDILDYINDNKELFSEVLLAGELPNFRTIRARAVRQVPTVLMDVAFRDSAGEFVMFPSLKSFPQKEMAQRCLKREYVLYYVSPEKVLEVHKSLHPDSAAPRFFDLSLDGIPESKSGGRSVDVLSIRYDGCRAVYSIAILQPARKGMGLPDDTILAPFLAEYDGSKLPLRYVIADAPKRAALSGLKQHSSNFACQYCVAEKSDRAYPWESCRADKRTNAETRRAAEAGEDAFGVKKLSPLRSIDTLDIIKHIPAEQLHLVDLGVIRKMIQLSFKCPQFKAKQVDFVRADDTGLNKELEVAKGLPNFSRRTRPLDTANYKAEEYRNLGLCFWPLIWKYIPQRAANVWLMTVFAYRAMILPDVPFTKWSGKYDVTQLLTLWYREFEAVYGKQNCSYNPHTFFHLPEVRELGQLSETSAYDFENHYNQLKRSYRPGSASTGKQALSSLLLANGHGHRCRREKHVSGKVTSKTDDSWCFVADVGLVRVSTASEAAITGRIVNVEATNELLPGLDFNDVWAFRLSDTAPPTDEEKVYLLEDVVGKCVVVNGLASVLPWNFVHQ